MTDRNRLYYLDNLKVFLIFLVILHHVGQAYGATGGNWPYSYPGARMASLGLFFMFNASFFMGLFFFISGYFFPGSFDRHGARRFIADKLLRFGIPVLFGAFLMIPVIEYVKYLHYTNSISFPDFYAGHWLGWVHAGAAPRLVFNIAHLWFIEHLLVYSILYALIRTTLHRPASVPPASANRDVPPYMIVLYIAALGIVTHLMRTSWGFPIDRWIFLFGFIQVEPAHIPQYLSLFILGVLAYRWSLLESLTAPRNMLWFVPALGVYAITVVQFCTEGRKAALYLRDYREAVLCVGLCIGLLALFRKFSNRTGPVSRFLADNAFGTYVIHMPIVVALQYAFDPVPAAPFTLFVVVSVLSIAASFGVSFLLRLIPGVKRVL